MSTQNQGMDETIERAKKFWREFPGWTVWTPELERSAEFMKSTREAMLKCCGKYVRREYLDPISLLIRLEIDEPGEVDSEVKVISDPMERKVRIRVNGHSVEIPLHAYNKVSARLRTNKEEMFANGEISLIAKNWYKIEISFDVIKADWIDIDINIIE